MFRPRRAARRAAAPHRRAPVRGAALRRHPARPHPGRGQLRRLPDEPVRQGRRRGPRPAQARRARHPDAVLDGPRRRPRSERVDGVEIDLDDEAAGAVRRPGDLPHDQPGPHPRRASRSSRRASASWSASPASRPSSDIITDISLFRPGPVKSDMITPYLEAKQGWRMPTYLHDDLRPILEQTHGVVVFHEQVIEMIAQFAGVTNAEADEERRALGDVEGMAETKLWFFPRRPRPRLLPAAWSRRSGRCSRRSRRSASARPTPRRSRCRPTSRPGSRRTSRRTSWPACSPTTPACTPSG